MSDTAYFIVTGSAIVLSLINLAITAGQERARRRIRCTARSHVGHRCDCRLGHDGPHFHRTYEWQGTYARTRWFPAPR